MSGFSQFYVRRLEQTLSMERALYKFGIINRTVVCQINLYINRPLVCYLRNGLTYTFIYKKLTQTNIIM